MDAPQSVPIATPRNRIKIAILSVLAFAACIMLAAAGGYFWLDTTSGHRFITRQISSLTFKNGMHISAGSIEGSVYGKMVVRNLSVSDPKGVFARIPQAHVDWRPFAYLGGHIDIRALMAPRIVLMRLPIFMDTKSDAPLLPDLDIDITKLSIARLEMHQAITGQRHDLRFDGRAKIADARAQIFARGSAVASPGVAGGDVFNLVLDAVPDNDKFDVSFNLNAPADGMVAGFTKIARPITAKIAGNGSWTDWAGRINANIGNDQFSDLALTGKSGTFTVKGETRPGLLVMGISRNLLEPVTQIDMTAAIVARKVTLNGVARSDNSTLSADGIADLGKSMFTDMTLDFNLLKPSTLAANLNGEGIKGRLLLNGGFSKPTVNYNIQAARIASGETALIGVSLRGEASFDADRMRIPVSGNIRQISGVNTNAAGLLTNVRFGGDLAVANGRILSDNLNIKSDRIDATAIIIADTNTGLYTGGLNGRVNGYRVDSVGVFNIDTDVDLHTTGARGFALTGTVRARSTKVFNNGVREFLGGNTLIRAGIAYGTDGILRVRSITATAPQFRLTSGQGSYTRAGGINFTGQGYSSRYGPLAVTVTGTMAMPVARVVAARPGYGIGLANVIATVRSNGRGYDVIASGDTQYGRFTANAAIASGKGPLTIDISRADFAGIALTGRIQQTGAGPFAGTLTGIGSGFDGTVLLSSYQGKQRAIVDAIANNAQFNGPANLRVGRAIIGADIILYDRPQIVADVQLADTTANAVTIAAGRVKINYRSGSGTAQLLAEGRASAPFRIAASAAFEPKLWRISAKGRANGVAFVTARPMRIVPGRSTYELLPATINLSQGKIQIAGVYGAGLNIQSRLTDADLAIFSAAYPALAAGGRATGSVNFVQSAPASFPDADVRLTITDFTRTSLATVSQPVDITVAARVSSKNSDARIIIRRQGAVVGRMQADLRPLGLGAGSWTTRLSGGPLIGGIRYNGPADTLFSLAGLRDQSLSGPIGVAADFSGSVQSPQLSGVVRANNLIYENDSYGTRLTAMRVRGTFTNDRLEVTELTAKAGKGTVSGAGFISLSSAQGYPVQLNLRLDKARVANSDMIAAAATGDITVISSTDTPPTIRGTLSLPETRYKIVRQGSAQVATLTGVRRKPALGRRKITGDPGAITSLPSKWKLDLRLVADNKVYVSGMGLESEWGADLKITGTTDAPIMAGTVNLVRGTLGFAGRSFQLDQGRIGFTGGSVTNPNIRLQASDVIDGVTTRITITGSGNNPDITFASTPNLPQEEIVARILFGNSVGELSAIQAVQLAGSLSSLRSGGAGLNPLGILQSAAGIDRLRILGPDGVSGRGTSVALGQYITNDVYVEIVTDARGYTASQIEVSLSSALSILGQVGSFGGSNVNIRYRKDY